MRRVWKGIALCAALAAPDRALAESSWTGLLAPRSETTGLELDPASSALENLAAPDSQTRARACRTLAIFGSRAHLAALRARSLDPDWNVRISAVRALFALEGLTWDLELEELFVTDAPGAYELAESAFRLASGGAAESWQRWALQLAKIPSQQALAGRYLRAFPRPGPLPAIADELASHPQSPVVSRFVDALLTPTLSATEWLRSCVHVDSSLSCYRLGGSWLPGLHQLFSEVAEKNAWPLDGVLGAVIEAGAPAEVHDKWLALALQSPRFQDRASALERLSGLTILSSTVEEAVLHALPQKEWSARQRSDLLLALGKGASQASLNALQRAQGASSPEVREAADHALEARSPIDEASTEMGVAPLRVAQAIHWSRGGVPPRVSQAAPASLAGLTGLERIGATLGVARRLRAGQIDIAAESSLGLEACSGLGSPVPAARLASAALLLELREAIPCEGRLGEWLLSEPLLPLRKWAQAQLKPRARHPHLWRLCVLYESNPEARSACIGGIMGDAPARRGLVLSSDAEGLLFLDISGKVPSVAAEDLFLL